MGSNGAVCNHEMYYVVTSTKHVSVLVQVLAPLLTCPLGLTSYFILMDSILSFMQQNENVNPPGERMYASSNW